MVRDQKRLKEPQGQEILLHTHSYLTGMQGETQEDTQLRAGTEQVKEPEQQVKR